MQALGLPGDAQVIGAEFVGKHNVALVHYVSQSAPEMPEACAAPWDAMSFPGQPAAFHSEI